MSQRRSMVARDPGSREQLTWVIQLEMDQGVEAGYESIILKVACAFPSTIPSKSLAVDFASGL